MGFVFWWLCYGYGFFQGGTRYISFGRNVLFLFPHILRVRPMFYTGTGVGSDRMWEGLSQHPMVTRHVAGSGLVWSFWVGGIFPVE